MFRSTLVVLAASAMVFASPSIIMSRSQCNSGAVSCCQDVQPAGSEAANNALFGLLDTALGVGIPIGIDCTPISVIGAGSSANW